MPIRFDGEFTVPAACETVLDAFADVPRMAGLMPGAFIEGQEPDGAWRGGMLVSFGPKKIRFQGKLTLQLDRASCSGSMVGRGSADMRAARVETRLRFVVTPAAGAQPAAGSVVSLSSESDMTGVLAEFARTGGPVVARALMEQFAERLREELAWPAGADAHGGAAAELPAADLAARAIPPASRPASLRLGSLFAAILRRWLRQLTRRAS